MAKTLLLFFITFATNIFAQNVNIIIGLPKSEIIYSGFDNLIKVSFNYKKIKNISLTCTDCDTIMPIDLDNNEWLIKANKIGTTIITAKNKKGKELGKRSFSVIQSPAPTVFLDSMNAQSTISEIPTFIKLELDRAIPIEMGFYIKKWEIIVDGVSLYGSGRKLNEEVKALLTIKKSGTLILKVDYMSAFGNEKIIEIFEFEIK